MNLQTVLRLTATSAVVGLSASCGSNPSAGPQNDDAGVDASSSSGGSGDGSTSSGSSGGSSSSSGGDSGSGSDAGGGSGCALALGSYSATNWPPACTRLYAPSSFYNTPLPANPKVDANSAAIISYYANNFHGFVGMGALQLGDKNSSAEFGHPYYFSRASDPVFTLHCLNSAMWGKCTIEGVQVHIPNGAQQAGGGDGHMGVLDQTNGIEYDMWQAQGPAMGGGTLNCTYGGMSPFVSGPGFATDGATASRSNVAAGLIRSEELIAGAIDHVLFGTVPCCNGHAVAPSATYGGVCSTCPGSGNGGSVGQVYKLDLSDAEIKALGKSAAGTAVLMAMAHYGIMQGDDNAWGFLLNAVVPSVSRTSVGGTDPIVAWAQAQGLPADGNGGYTLDYGSGIDWAAHLVALAPP